MYSKNIPALILLILLPYWAISQTNQKKLALIIGNATYQHGGALKNPVNDARSMAKTLEALGFEVMKYENITQNQMKQAINSYGIKLKDYEIGLFYYAGHGIQHKGTNFMIPIEAELNAAEQIEFDCVPADRVLAFMESANTKMNIIIMDACRNNPFERSWNRSSQGNGLAMMNAPTGTLIAYATAPGRVASDGENSNGLYTSVLLKYMNEPGLNIEQIFKRVRTEVSEKSFGAQVPWETTSLTGGDFYFVNKPVAINQPGVTVNNQQTGGYVDPETYYTLGNEKYDDYLYEDAIKHYSKALEIDAMYFKAMLWRAHAKFALQQYTDAILDYNKVLELSPGESQAYYYRGLSRYNLDRKSEAIPDFTMAIRYDRNYTNAYYWRGYCYYQNKNYFAAIEDMNKTISLSPSYADGYYVKGLALYGAEEFEEAIIDFSETIKLSPDYVQSYYMLANCYYSLGNYKDAITQYTLTIELDPNDAVSYYWRARSYKNLNMNTEAARDAQAAFNLDSSNTTYQSFVEEFNKK
jgi:tetratricopeptide (TPR) repeat protein